MRKIFFILSIVVLAVVAAVMFAPVLPKAAQTVEAMVRRAFAPSEDKPSAVNAKAESSDGKVAPKAETEAKGAPIGALKFSSNQILDLKIVSKTAGACELARSIVVPGNVILNADRIARVPVKVVGTATELRKRLGERVKKAEVVAVLDSREVADAKGAYLTAAVNFDLQKTVYERAKILWDKKISAEQQFLQARATFMQAELQFDLARQKLSALDIDAREVAKAAKLDSANSGTSSLRRYEIRSTVSGRIVERKVDVGAAVGSLGDPSELYTVVDLSSVWIELAVPTNELDRIKEGERVVISSGGDNDKETEGRVIFVSPLVSQETRSARVIAEIANRDLTWRPGSSVTAKVFAAQDAVRTCVPRNAIQTVDGKPVVFVRTKEGFEKREVVQGRRDDANIEIGSGLEPGQEVAVANTFLLKAELGKTEARDE